MSNVLDQSPFPWSDSRASALHSTLANLHPSGRSADLLARQAGLDTTYVNADQAPAFVWMELLNLGGQQGLNRELVRVVHDKLAPTAPKREFLASLLADLTTPVDSEPRSNDGSPRFVSSTDKVADLEALLYRDDLTIPVGRIPALVATLQKLVVASSGVCKLTVEAGGGTQYGTAFRISEDWLLTNWHVLHSTYTRAAATFVSAEFGYDDDGTGGLKAPVPIRCDPGRMIFDEDDDWAVIPSAEPMSGSWASIFLSPPVDPVVQGNAYIIQHPGGGRKRIGFVRNQICDFDDRVVHYLTDTQEGSSGAPVFDEQGQIIAVHHAGGTPQEILGKPPMKKNEGIRISRVLAGLKGRIPLK